MDPTFDLLVSLAGIAGVFVGFGALVVLGDHKDSMIAELHMTRSVVVVGLLTLLGALTPIAIGMFGVDESVLWRWSSGVFLTLIWFGLLHPSNRPVLATMWRGDLKASLFFWGVLEPMIQLPLFFAIFGVFPQHARAFYVLAVVINLLQCAQTLVQTVYARVARSEG